MRGFAKWGSALLIAIGLWLGLGFLAGAAVEAAPARATLDCSTYTPSGLVLSSASVEPGASVTIRGNGIGGDVLTFAISGSGVTTTSLGSGTVGSYGTFQKSFVVPPSYPAGTYTVTVRSTTCNRTGSVTITLTAVSRTGCAAGNPVTLTRGAGRSWKLVNTSPPFNTTKPVTLTLVQRTIGGASYTLYSGAWPATSTRTISVSGAAPLGQYYLNQTGSRAVTNAAISVSCPVVVVDAPAPAPPTPPLMPPRAIAAVIGIGLLVRLHRRQRAVRATSRR